MERELNLKGINLKKPEMFLEMYESTSTEQKGAVEFTFVHVIFILAILSSPFQIHAPT